MSNVSWSKKASNNLWFRRQARRFQKARRLLSPFNLIPGGVWSDMGCGEGIFTATLYDLIGPNCTIFAVDKDHHRLQKLHHNIKTTYPSAAIQPVNADFTQPLSLPPLDGLLVANALHFVPDTEKKAVLKMLVGLLKMGGFMIVVEYNTNRGNFVVPYPLDEEMFIILATEAGLQQPNIAVKVTSSFLGEMYAGIGVAA